LQFCDNFPAITRRINFSTPVILNLSLKAKEKKEKLKMKKIINKFTIAALSGVILISSGTGAMAKSGNVEVANTSSIVTEIENTKEFKTLTPEERNIIIKAYEELESLQQRIEKIQGGKEKLTPEEETMIENLIVQMEAIYDKIEPIEAKAFKDTDFGGDCGPMADEEFVSSKEATREYVNGLDMLNNDEKQRMIKAYDDIDAVFEKFDALEESKQEGSEGQALLSQVEKITQSISDLEDKVALSEKSSFLDGLNSSELESALKYADGLDLNEATKTELKRLYTEVFKVYDEFYKLYEELGDNEITPEFEKRDAKLENDLDALFSQIVKLEEKAK
jgi:hypothetical protein